MYLCVLHVHKRCVESIVWLKSNQIFDLLVLLENVRNSFLLPLQFRLIFQGQDLKFHGPFHCLNHKVDLTREEAENTLFQRRDQLEQYVLLFIHFLQSLLSLSRSDYDKKQVFVISPENWRLLNLYKLFDY